MTQLIIAGVEVVLPQTFSVTVKRENSFFTKNGEYTYDCTLRLDNRVNQQLYGFLHRLNKADQVATRRTAILMADGRVYCRGTEIVTKWTDQTVSIQIVSGESELNYFVGQEQKIEDLNLGDIGCTLASLEYHWPDPRDLYTANELYGDSDFCLPRIQVGDRKLNVAKSAHWSDPGEHGDWEYWIANATPQPYLCALLRRILAALHYNLGNVAWTNQLEQTSFRNLFIVNTVRTTEYAKMLPGWTVKDFLTEVERLCGIVFVTDNTNPDDLRCDIYLKTIYYQDARQIPLNDVVDEYEMEVVNDDSSETEFTASDVSYDLPDGQLSKLMKLPEGFLDSTVIVEHHRLSDILVEAQANPKAIHKVEGGDRMYILSSREYYENSTLSSVDCLIEVDQFANLDRADSQSTLELKITPAPMNFLSMKTGEVITLDDTETTDEETDDSDSQIEQLIKDFSAEESQAGNLYCAFLNGFCVGGGHAAYTDAGHAFLQDILYPGLRMDGNSPLPVGSLRLADLDTDYYQGGYQIDTQHAVTFQTFDPNHIDVRQVYVIGNKRYVVRDVEETITAEGRQPMWRLTCYPIAITDEAIENRWILTRGVWDDGGAWLDDGRWNDGQS